MILDFEVRSCSRRCAQTERELKPGDSYFSVVEESGAELVRTDYSTEAWEGPPEECLGWWQARIPTKHDSKPRLAPTDVMLNLFASLDGRPDEEPFRYLLGLMLLRKRALRREDAYEDGEGREVLFLHCPRRNENLELIVCDLGAEDIEALQQRMSELLYSDVQIGQSTGESERESQGSESDGE